MPMRNFYLATRDIEYPLKLAGGTSAITTRVTFNKLPPAWSYKDYYRDPLVYKATGCGLLIVRRSPKGLGKQEG